MNCRPSKKLRLPPNVYLILLNVIFSDITNSYVSKSNQTLLSTSLALARLQLQWSPERQQSPQAALRQTFPFLYSTLTGSTALSNAQHQHPLNNAHKERFALFQPLPTNQ